MVIQLTNGTVCLSLLRVTGTRVASVVEKLTNVTVGEGLQLAISDCTLDGALAVRCDHFCCNSALLSCWFQCVK